RWARRRTPPARFGGRRAGSAATRPRTRPRPRRPRPRTRPAHRSRAALRAAPRSASPLAQLLPQRRARDAEQLGGPALVASRVGERRLDVSALRLLGRFARDLFERPRLERAARGGRARRG